MTDSNSILVDGSFGEGGGQVLRTSLSLSAITGQPFTITNIRANRKPPGLRPQHLLSVTSTAKICGAQVEGASVGSRHIYFGSGKPRPGTYRFDVGTAGSTALVLHTLFFPLAMAIEPSTVTITGGTHVPMSPCYHYLEMQWLPALRMIGFQGDVSIAKAGFFPAGGGEMCAQIHPHSGLHPIYLESRGALASLRGISAIANLPEHIAERQRARALERLRAKGLRADIEISSLKSPGKGSLLLILAQFENIRACFFALGAIGKRAERVADEACNEFFEYLEGAGTMEPHLADQLLVPLALAGGESYFTTTRITQHLVTNAAIIEKFLNVRITITGNLGRPGSVTVRQVS